MLTLLRRFSRRYGALAGILCILLLCLGSTVQVTHSHLPGENHADCPLCVTAHAAVEIVILPSGYVAPVALVERPTCQPAHLIQRLVLAHPLWNRPPPTSLPIA